MYSVLGLLVLGFFLADAQVTTSSSSSQTRGIPQVSEASCGSFCQIQYDLYVQRQIQKERERRGFRPLAFQESLHEDSYVSSPSSAYNRLNMAFDEDTALSQAVQRKQIRWSIMARDMGIRMSEHGKSLTSALWGEIKRPILYEIRDQYLRPYLGRKLKTVQKLKIWLVEQTVESGASTVGLDARSTEGPLPSSLDFGIENYRVKFRPKIDPLKGRYGLRLKYKKYLDSSRPLYGELSAHYCNSNMGFRSNSICNYQHELSGRVSMTTMNRKMWYSMFISYQTESLNGEVAYRRDGEYYDYKPWVAGVEMTYAFYMGSR